LSVVFAFNRLRKDPLEVPATIKPPALPEDTYDRAQSRIIFAGSIRGDKTEIPKKAIKNQKRGRL
jgi:hypothetical protein